MRTKKYIAFSLWGRQLKYLAGALENAELSAKFFPGWTPVFYVSSEITKGLRQALEDFGALVVDCRNETKVQPCMWRFLAHDIPDCAKFISRDCDSRLSARDASLVELWEASGKACHFIQDHPNHKDILLAGAWGCRTDFFGASFRGLMEKYGAGNNVYGVDQAFIKHVLHPKARLNSFVSVDLTLKPEYVGQVFDEDGNSVEWSMPTWEKVNL